LIFRDVFLDDEWIAIMPGAKKSYSEKKKPLELQLGEF
jgi:hypothetical protein